MNNMNNIWEVERFDKLINLLKKSVNKFIVLAITTTDTNNKIKNFIKKYIKDKSKMYKKVTFLYYKANEVDFGKLKPMFDNNESKYPKMFIIWNVQIIVKKFLSIDELAGEQIESEFDNLHKFLKDGFLPIKDDIDENDENNEEKNDEENEEYNDEESFIMEKEKKVDDIDEKKKMDEKLKMLQEMQETVLANFLVEMRKRKKQEENRKTEN